MSRHPSPYSGCLAVLAVAAISFPAQVQAQEMMNARADLRARVIKRADGERRFFRDGRFLLLKVGPVNSGAGYLFMGHEDLPPGTGILRHRHEVDEEILIVHHGRVLFTFADDSAVAGPGDAVFLPPATWVSARAFGTDTASIFFIFPRGSVEQCSQGFGTGEGETPRPDTPEELEQEKRLCRMSY